MRSRAWLGAYVACQTMACAINGFSGATSKDGGVPLTFGGVDAGHSREAGIDARKSGDAMQASSGSGSGPDAAAGSGTGSGTGSGSGAPGCVIGGVSYPSGAANPIDACQACNLGQSAVSWTDVADGMPCGNGQVCSSGACGSQCDIGGNVYGSGTTNPSDPCQTCQPGETTSTWTSVPNGTSCTTGAVCNGGSCSAACYIGGMIYPPATENPNGCGTCQPALSTTTWTPSMDGLSCGAGEVCFSGTCGAGCVIQQMFFGTGVTNPTMACQSCQPGASTSMWTAVATGTSCAMGGGGGELCNGGYCTPGCFIGGTFYNQGAMNPAGCGMCQPGTSTTTWSNPQQGYACSAGKVCNGTTCEAGCYIFGMFYGSGAPNPNTQCQTCQPGLTTTTWSSVTNGMSCMTSEVCYSGNCQSGCYIGGTFYSSGQMNPSNMCQTCEPFNSTTIWTTLAGCGSH